VGEGRGEGGSCTVLGKKKEGTRRRGGDSFLHIISFLREGGGGGGEAFSRRRKGQITEISLNDHFHQAAEGREEKKGKKKFPEEGREDSAMCRPNAIWPKPREKRKKKKKRKNDIRQKKKEDRRGCQWPIFLRITMTERQMVTSKSREYMETKGKKGRRNLLEKKKRPHQSHVNMPAFVDAGLAPPGKKGRGRKTHAMEKGRGKKRDFRGSAPATFSPPSCTPFRAIRQPKRGGEKKKKRGGPSACWRGENRQALRRGALLFLTPGSQILAYLPGKKGGEKKKV